MTTSVCCVARACCTASCSTARRGGDSSRSTTVQTLSSCRAPFTGSQHRHGTRCFAYRSAAAAAAAPAAESVQIDVSKMEALGDRILVKPEEAAPQTSGGVLLAGTQAVAMQDALIGKILSVGGDVDISVKVGDKVLFAKYSSSDIDTNDGKVMFVAQKSILATLS